MQVCQLINISTHTRAARVGIKTKKVHENVGYDCLINDETLEELKYVGAAGGKKGNETRAPVK